MKIGIDIDGCMNNQHDYVINYATKYISENRLSYNVINFEKENTEEIFGWNEEIAHDFWEKYRQNLVKENIRPFCSEVINKLYDEGNEIFIITSRYNGDLWWDTKSKDNAENITISVLREQGIKYTNIIFSKNKLETIKEYNIQMMLEDNLNNIEKISNLIPVFIMNNTYNTSIQNKNTVRCYSWYDFYNKFHKFNANHKKILIFSNRNCDRYIRGCELIGLSATVNDSLSNLSSFDGLILVGGGDLDPELYGQVNTNSKNIEKEFDEKCMKCLDYFSKNNKPVLGICKGIQLINVYFGGTLKQDISNHDLPKLMHAHKVICNKISPLMSYYGNDFEVNSLHHQCIDKLGTGLEIIALSEDNIIEAIKKENIIAVQWHPERLLNNDFDTLEGKKIFQIFKDLF